MKNKEESYQSLTKRTSSKKVLLSCMVAFLFVLGFGFLAVSLALSLINISAGGDVIFKADHVYAKVTGTVTGTTQTNTLEDLNFDASSTAFVTPSSWSDIKFYFDDSNNIVFTINFENLSTENSFWVKITDSSTASNLIMERRVDSTDVDPVSEFPVIEVTKKNTSGATRSVNLTLKVDDVNTSVSGKVGVSIELSNTDPTIVKDASSYSNTLSFVNYNTTKNTVAVKAANKDISGQVVIPSKVMYNDVEYVVDTIGNSTSSVETTGAILKKSNLVDNLDSENNGAFEGCTKITSIVIPETVKVISDYAFNGCVALSSITIADGVTSIDTYAFSKCDSLTSVTIPNSVKTIGAYAFSECPNLTSVTISDSVTSMDMYVFNNCKKLTNVSLSKSLTAIPEGAFNGCIALKTMTIPSNIKEIGSYTFMDCTGLTSISIPSSVSKLNDGVFGGCSSLKTVNLANTITSIGDYAFRDCKKLETITLPNKTQTIGSRAFYGCTTLKQISLPDTVNSIGDNAFYSCQALESITIPTGIATIAEDTFQSCVALSTITLPNTLKTIESGAFASCRALATITIPSSVESLGDNAFSQCYSLTTVSIPNSVTKIGDKTFYMCKTLTSVVISESVVSIGREAFNSCSLLTSVEFKNTTGWTVSRLVGGPLSLSSTDLADTAKAAELLTNTYKTNLWTK